MEEKIDEDLSECTFEESDGSVHADLCCCYTMDEDDGYGNPCDEPAEDCCCCDPMYE